MIQRLYAEVYTENFFTTVYESCGQIRLMDLRRYRLSIVRLNEKDGRFIINTKKYKGYRRTLEKLIEVTDEGLK